MSIQEIINNAITKEQEERKTRTRSGLWSPSSFGKCYRYQYWNRKNEPQTNPPDIISLRKFKCGDLFHDFVQGYMKKEQVEVKCEKEDILGYADIVTSDAVYDIKSMHSKAFWYMEKANYDINTEKFPNILQVITYAWILGKPFGRLVFISKDDLCISEYGFSVEQWLPKLKEELKELRAYWNTSITPQAKPRAYGGKECSYCPYLDKCVDIEKENHPTKIKEKK